MSGVTDDMYQHLIYDGFEFSTIAQVEPKLYERTLTMNGVSKAYCMTSWHRLWRRPSPADQGDGQAAVADRPRTPARSARPRPSRASSGPQDFIAEHNKSFRERRDLVVDMLNKAPGLHCHRPEGAFYVYPSCAGAIGKQHAQGKEIKTDDDFVTYLLEAEGVAAVQGSAFGLSPFFRHLLRHLDRALLREACTRIQRACTAFGREHRGSIRQAVGVASAVTGKGWLTGRGDDGVPMYGDVPHGSDGSAIDGGKTLQNRLASALYNLTRGHGVPGKRTLQITGADGTRTEAVRAGLDYAKVPPELMEDDDFSSAQVGEDLRTTARSNSPTANPGHRSISPAAASASAPISRSINTLITDFEKIILHQYLHAAFRFDSQLKEFHHGMMRQVLIYNGPATAARQSRRGRLSAADRRAACSGRRPLTISSSGAGLPG